MQVMAGKAKRTRHFPVVVEQDEDGVYIVTCPAFRGCHSHGRTIDEAMANIREAIELCLEEEGEAGINRFIGLREVELPVHA
jgi:predicted RNase H-like HicB family nuclease